MNPAIMAAYRRVRDSERERDSLVSATYLPGDVITYTHGDNHVDATVVQVSGDRLLVAGRTGREYWIGAYRLTA